MILCQLIVIMNNQALARIGPNSFIFFDYARYVRGAVGLGSIVAGNSGIKNELMKIIWFLLRLEVMVSFRLIMLRACMVETGIQ
jgi:hypothetical protein